MNAHAITVDQLSKCYRLYDRPRDRLRQSLYDRFWRTRNKAYFREFWALHELSFHVGKGQTLGIVGRNGSGKSTLLQLLCGTIQPTTGHVATEGRIGALLELGSGFNPEFTGLENIYLNAALVGLSRNQTDQHLDRILAFADIGNFINEPVRTYSSGMAVRLAFAVQAHVNPDILLIDEALAVGDELFQKKCYAHLERLKERGTAVLLVTHSCPQIIQHCDQALLLHKGRARMIGEPARVTVVYQRLISSSDEEWNRVISTLEPNQIPASTDALQSDPNKTTFRECRDNQEFHEDPSAQDLAEAWFDSSLEPQSTEIYPSHGACIIDAWFEQDDAKDHATARHINTLPFGSPFTLVIRYTAQDRLSDLGFSCHIANHTGQRITGQTLPTDLSSMSSNNLLAVRPGQNWVIRFSFKGGLWPGTYFVGAGIIQHTDQGRFFVHRVIDYRALRVIELTPVSVVGSCSLQDKQPNILAQTNADQPILYEDSLGLNMNIE